MANLFVYGTLTLEPVIRELLGTVPICRAAVARDVIRRQFRGRDYPGLVEAKGSTVSGVLLTGLQPDALSVLDRFEGADYERRTVRLTTGTAEAYFVRDACRDQLSEADWDPEAFQRDKLGAYLEICRDFRSVG